MARGRMINSSITEDKRVNDLSDDTCRLSLTWLITFADCEGRVTGDPAMIRAKVFPRRNDVTIEQIQRYIVEWQSAQDPDTGLGLVVWYEAKGDLWIWFPGFERNQAGLRKDKEAPSSIPAPPDAEVIVRHLSVTTTEPVRTNSVLGTPEKKRKETNRNGTTTETQLAPGNGSDDTITPFALMAREYELITRGMVGGKARDLIGDAIDEGLPIDMIRQARLAMERNEDKNPALRIGNRWGYALQIARDCIANGTQPGEPAKQKFKSGADEYLAQLEAQGGE